MHAFTTMQRVDLQCVRRIWSLLPWLRNQKLTEPKKSISNVISINSLAELC